MNAFVDLALLSLLLCGFLAVIYIIAADRTRYLIGFDLSVWRDRYYLRVLPNFLQALYDHHYKSPWPTRRNAVSAAFFRFRLRPVLRAHPALARRNFIHHHLTFMALIEQFQPYIQDFLLQDQQRIVSMAIVDMEDTLDRERLVNFLDALRRHRDKFTKSLTPLDQRIIIHMIDRRFIPTLRTAHAIFQEHGYSLMPELNMLRHWESLTGTELVQEIHNSVFLDLSPTRIMASIPAPNRAAPSIENDSPYEEE